MTGRAASRLMLLALSVGACTSGGRPTAPTELARLAERAPSQPAPVEARPPTVVVEDPVAPVSPPGCLEAARLARRGEHKPAVDGLHAALRGGAECDPEIVALIAESNATLRSADDLIREGLRARDAGDLAEARRSFAAARALYPRYYWIDSLDEELDAREAAMVPSRPPEAVAERERDRLREEGARLHAEGKLTEALVTLEAAATLGAPSADLEADIDSLRSELVTAFIAGAQRAQRAGDDRRAVEFTLDALDLAPPAPARGQLVDFARRLGLNLFSDGQLVRARDLWRASLALDVGNELLIQYLEEVEARLRSLDAIKKSGS